MQAVLHAPDTTHDIAASSLAATKSTPLDAPQHSLRIRIPPLSQFRNQAASPAAIGEARDSGGFGDIPDSFGSPLSTVAEYGDDDDEEEEGSFEPDDEEEEEDCGGDVDMDVEMVDEELTPVAQSAPAYSSTRPLPSASSTTRRFSFALDPMRPATAAYRQSMASQSDLIMDLEQKFSRWGPTGTKRKRDINEE